VDPSSEIATLVVSYLWALRDLHPSATHVRELAPDRIYETAGADFALIARLRDLAHREASETWPPAEGRRRATKGVQLRTLDGWLDRIIYERLTRDGMPEAYLAKRTWSVALWFQNLRETATPEDYEMLGRRVLPPFVTHATALVGFFGDMPVRAEVAAGAKPPDAVTRETFTDAIAAAMLDRGILYAVAAALDYRPILLRAIGGGPGLLDDPQYPRALIDACDAGEQAVPFGVLLHAELDEIERSRESRRREPIPPYSPMPAPSRAYARNLLGVSLSGGGIRSATFSLGLLQGLASRGWLPHVDYLSTVSGGGYIGSWLLAWIKRRGSVLSVQESLRGYGVCGGDGVSQPVVRNPDPAAEHIRPIRLLREYSNYLAPRFSAFSADTWTIVSIWVRNTALNLLVLMLFLMAALIAPRLLGVVFDGTTLQSSLICVVASLFVASMLIGFNLRSFDDPVVAFQSGGVWRWLMPGIRPSERGDASFVVIASIVAPGLLAGFFGAVALWQFAADPPKDGAARLVGAWTFALLATGITFSAALGQWVRRPRTAALALGRTANILGRVVRSGACAAAASMVGAVVIAELWDHLVPLLFADSHRGMWLVVGFGPLALLAVSSLVIVLYLGLEGVTAQDELREWWSRLGAWFGLVGAAWAFVAAVSFFAPYAVASAGLYAGTLGIGWGAFTGVGAWLASSGKSNGVNEALDKNPITSFVITAAPYLFVAGFFVLVAVLTHALLLVLSNHAPDFWGFTPFRSGFTAMEPLPFSLRRYVDTYWAILEPHSMGPVVLSALLLALAIVLAWRVDVNEFSMHHFYKNRLVRAYLGASRSRLHRRPNAFTGLDMDDDIKLWRFTTRDTSGLNDQTSDCRPGFSGPYPIINATLNMTAGDELAWQERKGQSFVFTPLYCGFDFSTKQTAIAEKVTAQFAYRPTSEFASPSRWLGNVGINIGTAVAISGAAANPNAGYHSSPAVAFLLTVFNARLGWWIGNPGLARWRRPSPQFGMFYLLSELFGFAGVTRKFVNLSDGGHFDNMGLYELVRRRCRYIVVCDAEQDDRYSFNGMAGAIRKCRVDFGVAIDLATELIVPGPDGRSRQHVAVGTINYPGEGCGTLVYVKASLTGPDDPADVREYRASHEEFPHQTTADQFFNESQFESYRALGQHIADRSFPDWPPTSGAPSPALLERLFAEVAMRCGARTEPSEPGE
jgi:hypothetical protein